MDMLNTHNFWHHFEHYVQKYPGLGGLFGAAISSLITGSILLLIVVYYTKRFSRINATVEFSKRFHELLEQQQKLNNDFTEAHSAEAAPRPTERERNDARAWWWRFFDLLLYEYEFRRHGQVEKARFREWMRWRWYDFNGENGQFWNTCGMRYAEGWDFWRTRRAVRDNALITFLEDIHGATETGAEYVVKVYSSKIGRCRLIVCRSVFGQNIFF
jgi:hypothetical protein